MRGYLHPVRPTVGFNLIDGLIRMSFFLIMIVSFSLLTDIRRVFEYHGAEHKTVFTWEKGLALTVDNARPQPRQHPRCGTSFLMVVMLVSILLFSVIRFDSLLLNFLVRIAFIPLVAGLSYEIIRLSAKKESGAFFKIITRPGVWLQNVTTKEPDDSQLEVAIEALKESLKLEPQPAEGGGQQRQCHHRERRYGFFERVVPLPPNADDENVLIVRPIPNANHAFPGSVLMCSPQKIVVELLR